MPPIKYQKVEITQNELLKTVAEVPQWEAQVLLAVWGEDAVVKEAVPIDRDLPDPRDEFARLANKYGPKDDDNPYVARVFGNFGPGVRALEKEFDAAVSSNEYGVVNSPAEQSTLVAENAGLRAELAALQNDAVPEHPELENANLTIGAGEVAGEDGEDSAFDASSLLPPGTTLADLSTEPDEAEDDITDLTG